MAGINRDMDSYLRRRKGGGVFSFSSSRPSSSGTGPSWWSGLFAGKAREDDGLDSVEREELMTMEQDLKTREEEIEHVKEFEEELEERQEQEVGLYHKLRRFFSGGPQAPVDDDEAAFLAAQAASDAQAALNTPDVQADFRDLAQIQMRWLSRMPSRMMTEFKESEDFRKLTEILERRGVAKRKAE